MEHDPVWMLVFVVTVILVLAAMVVVAGTLLLQGPTLSIVARRFGVRGPDPREDALAAATIVEAAGPNADDRLEREGSPAISARRTTATGQDADTRRRGGRHDRSRAVRVPRRSSRPPPHPGDVGMIETDAGLWHIPTRFHRLFDDGSSFPPADLPLADALALHVEHSRSPYRRALGPFMVRDADLDTFARASAGLPDRSVWFALLIADIDEAGPALQRAAQIRTGRLAGGELSLPEDMAPDLLVPRLDASLRGAGVPLTEIYVEVPRDDRRVPLLDALADSDYDAKFRTGGLTEGMFPDEAELAESIVAAVGRHLPFKAVAGFHHAIRTTDRATGLEHHGFLNLFLAADTARQGVDSDAAGLVDRVTEILADRSGETVARAVTALAPERATAARASFSSFGTDSLLEPLAELVDLGLVRTDLT